MKIQRYTVEMVGIFHILPALSITFSHSDCEYALDLSWGLWGVGIGLKFSPKRPIGPYREFDFSKYSKRRF